MFARFHRECIGGADGYEFVGLQHGTARGVAEEVFGPGENAIVDFKYSSSLRLTWWFDHHESAFPTIDDREHFDAGQQGAQAMRQFFDPDYISCTSWIAKVGAERFGFDIGGLGDLLKWADIIDGARFPSAAFAVEMKEPAMRLALVIENSDDPTFIPRLIPMLTEHGFAEIVEQPFVHDQIAPLWEKHLASMELIRSRAELKDGVIYFDLTDQFIEGLNKFVPYYFYPEATYTIALSRSETRVKISVGTSPWTTRPAEELKNISEICERFGGGGHARVGAISLAPDEVHKAREIALGIAADLRLAERRR